jgi:hypothetical protein
MTYSFLCSGREWVNNEVEMELIGRNLDSRKLGHYSNQTEIY